MSRIGHRPFCGRCARSSDLFIVSSVVSPTHALVLTLIVCSKKRSVGSRNSLNHRSARAIGRFLAGFGGAPRGGCAWAAIRSETSLLSPLLRTGHASSPSIKTSHSQPTLVSQTNPPFLPPASATPTYAPATLITLTDHLSTPPCLPPPSPPKMPSSSTVPKTCASSSAPSSRLARTSARSRSSPLAFAAQTVSVDVIHSVPQIV